MNYEISLKAETLAANFPGLVAADGAVVPLWQPATTYEKTPESAFTYLRNSGLVFETPEKCLAGLEGGAGAFLLSSRIAAADAVFRTVPAGGYLAWRCRKPD